ncbi:MAG: ribonuclease P protein component [Myxococcales bacterium]|nr:ribonuclease P protein component [Myxococcales bacterium]
MIPSRAEAFRPIDRIRKTWEFRTIQRSGRRVHSPHFVYVLSPSKDRPRLGITVSKKVSPKAVLRNRVKRFVREVFRRHRHLFPTDCDVVVIAKRGASDLALRETFEEFQGAAEAMRRTSRSLHAGKRP